MTTNDIKNAILSHFKQTGKAPTPASGDASNHFGSRVTWASVNQSLKEGHRGLPGGSSLAKLGVEMGLGTPRVSWAAIDQSLKDHRKNTGRLPSSFALFCQRLGRTLRLKKAH